MSLLFRLVACTWRDAHGDVKAELDAAEIAASRSYKFTSFGILVRDDRGVAAVDDPVVAIAHERGEDGRFRGVTFIPVEMVTVLEDRGQAFPKTKRRRRMCELPSTLDTTLTPAVP